MNLLKGVPGPDPLVFVREPLAYLLRKRYDLLPVVGQPRKRLAAEERYAPAPRMAELVENLPLRLFVERPAVLLVLCLRIKASGAFTGAAADEKRNAKADAVRDIGPRNEGVVHIQASNPLCLVRCSTSSCLPTLNAVL